MKTFKTVTLYTTDRGKKDEVFDAFMADRKHFNQSKKLTNQRLNSRCKSAAFFGELRPVTYSELRESFPTVLNMNQVVSEDRKESVFSARTKNEIQSAVLLTEERSKKDFVNAKKDCCDNNNMNEPCIYKVHSSNHLSKSAKRVIENRIYKNNQRWKSASIDFRRHDINPISRIQSIVISQQNETDIAEPANSSIIENCEENANYSDSHHSKGQKLITSISNSLTNVLTIDDIYGVKGLWERKEFADLIQIKEPQKDLLEKTDATEASNRTTKRTKRESVLRDYMTVYINWRISNSIQEHRDLICGKTRKPRIRTAGPQNRLHLFQKILEEKQDVLSKKRNSKYRDSIQLNQRHLEADLHTPRKNQHRIASPFRTELNKINVKHDFPEAESKSHLKENDQSSENDNSEEYSDIDWLQCEDI